MRRQQYIKSLRDRGWTFVNSPTFDAVARLGDPPFGIGFHRRADDQIIGLTSSGRSFQVIEYSSALVGLGRDGHSHPPAPRAVDHRRPDPARCGVAATGVPSPAQLGPGWQIGALDPAFAAEVLTPQLCERLNAMAAGQPGVNLSIDVATTSPEVLGGRAQ